MTNETSDKANKPTVFNVKPSLQSTKKLVNELMRYVDDNNLSVNIAGKKYLQVEAWQFTGSQLGLTAIVTDIKEIDGITTESKPVFRYQSTVEVYHVPTNQLVSRGFALCSSSESKKKGFDEYAVASMAQTRAIGKAYRNILAWLPKLAGYEGTPVEEISDTMRETMQDDLATKRAEVFKAFKSYNITDSQEMLNHIDKAISKQSLDTTDDANLVLEYLKSTYDEA